VKHPADNDNEGDPESWTSCEANLCGLGDQLQEAGDHQAANYLFALCIRARHAEACLSLARYFDDLSVPRDKPRAVKLLKQASKWGHPSGAWNLAMEHRLRGRRRWYLHWLGVAARLGEEDAITALAQLGANGEAWWRLDGVYDPPHAQRGFRPDVVSYGQPSSAS
jgi:TPR repeat protein